MPELRVEDILRRPLITEKNTELMAVSYTHLTLPTKRIV